MSYEIGNLFSNLGLAGWGNLEPCILAAMRTRTPVLLIGDRGTSKTEFAYRLCRALQGSVCNFQKYDTADASLDDILGLPDLRKLESGEVGYIGTGTSIWKKTAVIWTEINRASPMFQGKLLEVVRTGTIHGAATSVDFQFADCNPPRATGKSVGHDTYFMQDALGARFFCVHVPRGNAIIYDAAMTLAAQRAAFDNDDHKEIGKFCKPIGLLWMDYVKAEPTDAHKKQARAVIRSVLTARGEGTYFDVRAAIRTTAMLEALFLLHDMTMHDFDISDAAIKCVIGNVPELNGILRNDRTGEDMASWESDIKTALRNHVRATADPGQGSPAGIAYKIVKNGTFDDLSINEFLLCVRASANKPVALSSLLGKQPLSQTNRSPDFRKSHARVIASVLEILRDSGVLPETVKLPNGSTLAINTDVPSRDTGTALAAAWFAALT